MADKVSGSCYCKRVKFEIELPTRFCAHCHCNNCRRAHGAAFVTWVGIPTDRFEVVAGDVAWFTTDTKAMRGFCPTCGTTLFYTGPRWADEVHVARANLEGEIDREVAGHVYVDHKASWFEITDDLPQFGGEDGTEPKSST